MNRNTKSRRAAGILLGAAVAIGLSGCQEMMFSKNNPNLAAETQTKDWNYLRESVKQYEAARTDLDQRSMLVVQNRFRSLMDRHSANKIGEEALFYVGRIYYDMRDYHDARTVFLKHKEAYPRSSFRETIERLEAEMDKDHERYKEWLKQNRGTL